MYQVLSVGSLTSPNHCAVCFEEDQLPLIRAYFGPRGFESLAGLRWADLIWELKNRVYQLQATVDNNEPSAFFHGRLVDLASKLQVMLTELDRHPQRKFFVKTSVTNVTFPRS
jgi:hypothetical protein